MSEWSPPGRWAPGDALSIAKLNVICEDLDWLHDAWTGKVMIGTLRAGPEDELPATGDPGEVYFATDTGTLFIRGTDKWFGFLSDFER
jgi:hypothetical protein